MSIFDELAGGVLAPDEAAMHTLAGRVAAALPPDSTLALSGDLGAGKTTFVRGLAAAWNVREVVTSPSFTLCNLHQGDRLLVHVDAYRLSGAGTWEALMIDDFLRSPWCLAIEWPERLGADLPGEAIWLRFEMQPDNSRSIRRVYPHGNVA